MVEELKGPFVSAAGCVSTWHSVRDDDAGVGGLFLSFFSPMWLRMVVCYVRCSSYGVCSCDGVCFDPLCTSVVSSYMT
jgi:hypothetical protein